MILIAHRALTKGPDPSRENTPSAITECLQNHLHVEVDVWHDGNQWYLGHDAPTINVSWQFLTQVGLWIHAKNWDAAQALLNLHKHNTSVNFFWHENDERTLTSQGYWWTYPGKPLGERSIAVMPEWHEPNRQVWQTWPCAGICSDWVGHLEIQ